MSWRRILIGLLAVAIAVSTFPALVYFDEIDAVNINNLITKCEAPLPRDQHCKIIAIPEEVTE